MTHSKVKAPSVSGWWIIWLSAALSGQIEVVPLGKVPLNPNRERVDGVRVAEEAFCVECLRRENEHCGVGEDGEGPGGELESEKHEGGYGVVDAFGVLVEVVVGFIGEMNYGGETGTAQEYQEL